MLALNDVIAKINADFYNKEFERLYSKSQVPNQKQRFTQLCEYYKETFGEPEEVRLFSVPGRCEIVGNHTDHNNGCVVAASVNLDIISIAAKTGNEQIRLKSVEYPMNTVDIRDIEPKEHEQGTSDALIRGIVARFKELGYKVGGFDAVAVTSVLKGSGLSSSAAYEVLIATVLNNLFNDGKISALEISEIAQYAENRFFGKPCGLMDQIACAYGGVVAIDFKNQPAVVEKIEFDLTARDFSVVIVDNKTEHSDLSHEYAAITYDMKSVANYFGKDTLSQVDPEQVSENIATLRKECGDRAVLRALHFYKETQRAKNLAENVKNGKFQEFLDLVTESGLSSFQYLQNIFCSVQKEQGLTLALFLAEDVLKGRGAWRVQGGGFGGTTINFVPNDLLDTFNKKMSAVFGDDSVHVLNIRPDGAVEFKGHN